MSKIVKFGENVEGYSIPVLNEREIRAAAGILFLMMLFSIQAAAGKGDFLMLKYAVVIFLTDIYIRLFINPKFSPSLIIGRIIVRNQTPEYVGAQQKKFAWIIGVILAMTMFVLLVVVNSYSVITGLICLICLIFLFFESVFGICLGCKVYSWIYKEKAQYCPGEVCDVKAKQAIQKVSAIQLLIVVVFIAFMFGVGMVFHDNFSIKPHNLFGATTEELQPQIPENNVNTLALGAFSVSLSVKDIQTSRDFYQKLGFLEAGGDVMQNWLILRNGVTTIGLFQGMFEKNMLTFNPGWDKTAQRILHFTDVRDLQRQLKAAGVEFVDEADENSEEPASFLVINPDGNPILVDQHI